MRIKGIIFPWCPWSHALKVIAQARGHTINWGRSPRWLHWPLENYLETFLWSEGHEQKAAISILKDRLTDRPIVAYNSSMNAPWKRHDNGEIGRLWRSRVTKIVISKQTFLHVGVANYTRHQNKLRHHNGPVRARTKPWTIYTSSLRLM